MFKNKVKKLSNIILIISLLIFSSYAGLVDTSNDENVIAMPSTKSVEIDINKDDVTIENKGSNTNSINLEEKEDIQNLNSCSLCGKGFFSLCDNEKCSKLGENCIFTKNFIGGTCKLEQIKKSLEIVNIEINNENDKVINDIDNFQESESSLEFEKDLSGESESTYSSDLDSKSIEIEKQNSCSSCGSSFLSLCSLDKCSKLGSECFFTKGVIGGSCEYKEGSNEGYNYYNSINKVYLYFLKREVDKEGLNYWDEMLTNGDIKYFEFIWETFNSEEFKELNNLDSIAKDLDNVEYTRIIYKSLLGFEGAQSDIEWHADFSKSGYKSKEDMFWKNAFFPNAAIKINNLVPNYLENNVCNKLKEYSNTNKDASEVLNICILNSNNRDFIEIPPGKYTISDTVFTLNNQGFKLRTQGLTQSDKACELEDSRCAEFVISPNYIKNSPAFYFENSKNIILDHLIFNGNKKIRYNDQAKKLRRIDGELNSFATTMDFVDSSNVEITNSVFKNALAGTGLHLEGSNFIIKNNLIAYNGVHNIGDFWADGITAGVAHNSEFIGNKFIDNTDIDLVFGDATNSIVKNNEFLHTDDYSGSSFTVLTFHAWSHYDDNSKEWIKDTKGTYEKTIISENTIDCGSKKNCGYGIYVGGDAWYLNSDMIDGEISNNIIKNTQLAISVNEGNNIKLHNNKIENSGGIYLANCNEYKVYRDAHVSLDSLNNNDLSFDDYIVNNIDLDICVPNQINDFTQKKKSSTQITNNIYRFMLGRDADKEGLKYWGSILETSDLLTVMLEFYNSDEFKTKYDIDNLSNEDYLKFMYKYFYFREADQKGFDYWFELLDSNQITRKEFFSTILSSKEFNDNVKSKLFN